MVSKEVLNKVINTINKYYTPKEEIHRIILEKKILKEDINIHFLHENELCEDCEQTHLGIVNDIKAEKRKRRNRKKEYFARQKK